MKDRGADEALSIREEQHEYGPVRRDGRALAQRSVARSRPSFAVLCLGATALDMITLLLLPLPWERRVPARQKPPSQWKPTQHNRRSIRLRGYDYSQAGVYFVIICAWNRECLFGDAVDGRTILNDFGEMVAESWEWLATRHGYVELDEWMIMPNHMHGIIVITDVCRGGSSRILSPVEGRTAPTEKRKPIGRLVGAFKTISTKRTNHLRKTPGVKIGQRNYYEHIIRNDDELNGIREYIANNPAQWEMDRENPNFVVGTGLKPAPGRV